MLDKTHSGTINGINRWPEQIPDRRKNVDGQFLTKTAQKDDEWEYIWERGNE